MLGLNVFVKIIFLSPCFCLFSIKVLRFTIRSYRTVDLMRTSNTAQKNRCRQEDRTVPETSYGTVLLAAKM